MTLPAGVTNQEYWTVDGVSLHTHAWAVSTVGSRYTVPLKRGDDQHYPYVPGDVWLPKLPAARTLSLPMWMAGYDPVTGQLPADPTLQWNENWALLRRLFFQTDRQFVLGRRWLRQTEGGPVIQYAEALGELAGDMAPTMQQRARCSFTVDIKLADPFFYGDEITTEIADGQTVTVTNAGDYAAVSHLYVDFVTGAGRLTNTTPTPPVWCELPTGAAVTLDVRNWLARTAGGVNRTAQVKHAGTYAWMALRTGANVLTMTGGAAVLRYRPAYL